MDNLILKAILIFALPVVIILWTGYLMVQLSGGEQVSKLHDKSGREIPGLGTRRTGYDLDAIDQRWTALGANLKYERLGLELDLVYPFIYGGALAAALLLTWAQLGRTFSPFFLIAPVALTMIADWTENSIQLGQLKLFEVSHRAGLQSTWIRVASFATMTKVWLLIGSSLLLIGLLVWMVVRGVTQR